MVVIGHIPEGGLGPLVQALGEGGGGAGEAALTAAHAAHLIPQQPTLIHSFIYPFLPWMSSMHACVQAVARSNAKLYIVTSLPSRASSKQPHCRIAVWLCGAASSQGHSMSQAIPSCHSTTSLDLNAVHRHIMTRHLRYGHDSIKGKVERGDGGSPAEEGRGAVEAGVSLGSQGLGGSGHSIPVHHKRGPLYPCTQPVQYDYCKSLLPPYQGFACSARCQHAIFANMKLAATRLHLIMLSMQKSKDERWQHANSTTKMQSINEHVCIPQYLIHNVCFLLLVVTSTWSNTGCMHALSALRLGNQLVAGQLRQSLALRLGNVEPFSAQANSTGPADAAITASTQQQQQQQQQQQRQQAPQQGSSNKSSSSSSDSRAAATRTHLALLCC